MGKLIIDTETSNLPNKITEDDIKEFNYSSLEEAQEQLKLAFQVSFIYINKGKIEVSNTYCKPELDINFEASEITGIIQSDVEEYPSFSETETYKSLKDILENDKKLVIVGHNINYDINILKRENLDFSNTVKLDTLEVSRYYNKESKWHRLGYLNVSKNNVKDVREMINQEPFKSALESSPSATHNSMYDCIVTFSLLNKFTNELRLKNPDTPLKDIYSEFYRISSEPFEIEKVPYGFNQGQLFTELTDMNILYMLKMNSDDKNYKHSLYLQIEKRGGLKTIIDKLQEWEIRGLYKNMEAFTNELFKEELTDYLSSKGMYFTPEYIGFGKHSGKTISEILDTDKGYLEWINKNVNEKGENKLVKDNKISQETLDLIKKGLEISSSEPKHSVSDFLD